jgi:anti-sigma B factor antagonist
VVVSVVGVVDVFESPTLEAQLIELIADDQTQIIVDLTQVKLIDSSALGVLLGALKQTQGRGGTLRVVASSKSIIGQFELTGLSQIFSVFPTLDEALAAPLSN